MHCMTDKYGCVLCEIYKVSISIIMLTHRDSLVRMMDWKSPEGTVPTDLLVDRATSLEQSELQYWPAGAVSISVKLDLLGTSAFPPTPSCIRLGMGMPILCATALFA